MNNDVKSISKVEKLSKRELLQQLLDLENNNVGELGKSNETTKPNLETINDNKNETDEEINESIVKPKKKLTEKQLEALKKGQQTRDANTKKRKEEAQRKLEEERKIMEAKIVKKAISIKKKEIKKQAILDEISDDDTPIQKIKEISQPLQPLEKVTNGSGVALGEPNTNKKNPSPLSEPVKQKIIFF
jgi:hypothetical protein